MNPNLHSFFVHFPVALAFVLPLLIIWAIVQFRKDESSANRIWTMVAIPMFIMAVGTVFAVMAGESAEELLEKYMDEKPIHEHEEIAEPFAMLVYVTAGLSFFIFLFREKRRLFFMYGLLALSVVMLGMAMVSGKTGGEIVHKYESPVYLNKAISEGGLDNAVNGAETMEEEGEEKEE